jgi:hypothetical protein
MRRNRGLAFVEWFRHLQEGDPVAWGILITVGVVAAFFGLLILKVGRDHRREDEARARKYSRRP